MHAPSWSVSLPQAYALPAGMMLSGYDALPPCYTVFPSEGWLQDRLPKPASRLGFLTAGDLPEPIVHHAAGVTLVTHTILQPFRLHGLRHRVGCQGSPRGVIAKAEWPRKQIPKVWAEQGSN
jgi:hypothetical protein